MIVQMLGRRAAAMDLTRVSNPTAPPFVVGLHRIRLDVGPRSTRTPPRRLTWASSRFLSRSSGRTMA